MIHTSNYNRQGTNTKAIAISYSIIPAIRSWFSGKHLPALGPSGDLLGRYKDGSVTEEEYVFEYISLLTKRKITPEIVLEMVPDGSVLLCYERPFEFCHRSILSEYVYRGTGICFPEWLTDIETEKFRKAEAQQATVDDLLKF